jgi:hypothetical protein
MTRPPHKSERDARKAFRQVDAKKAMTEHEIAQKAFSNNRERLKAERLARDAAANPPETQRLQSNGEMTSTEIKLGDRVRLNEMGISRSPKIKVRKGMVVALSSHRSASFGILFDGNKRPTRIHSSYIELDDVEAKDS